MTVAMAAIETALAAWWTGFGMQAQVRDRPRDITRPDVKDADVDPDVLTGATAFFKAIGMRSRGIDEIRYTVNGDDDTLGDAEVTGNRELTISCMVESYRDAATTNALYLCDRAITRLSMPSVEQSFRTAGMGIIETTPVVDLPYQTDGRVFSRASFDLRVNVNASEVDESQYTIAIVLVTSQWRGPDSELLPDNYQLDDEPIDSTV